MAANVQPNVNPEIKKEEERGREGDKEESNTDFDNQTTGL